ncbi:MAG: SpoIIE family protein phosphatase [Bacteroidales bacterium]|nr:SpoIIE family protein phosphatase [Bacteroidales bacterium]
MRKFFYILIVFLLAANDIIAQNIEDDEFDSLKTVFYSLKDSDTSKLSICKEITVGLINLDSTIVWANKLAAISKIQNRGIEEGYALFYKAWAYYYKEDHNSSIDCSFKSLLVADSLSDSFLKVKNYLNIGNNYFSLPNYSGCAEFYLMSLELSRVLNDTSNICLSMRNLADTYSNKSMYSKAYEIYNELILIDSTRQNNPDMRRNYYGVVYVMLSEYFDKFIDQDVDLLLKAKRYILKADSIPTKSYYSRYVVLKPFFVILLSELQYYKYKGNRRKQILDSMANIVSQAKEYAQIIDLGPEALYNDICQVNYYVSLGNYPRAKYLIDSIQNLISHDSIIGHSFQADLDLARDYYFTQLGIIDSAYYYKTRYFQKQINSLSIDNAVKSSLDFAQSRFNSQIQEREQRNEQRRRLLIYWLLGLGVVILFIVWDYIRKNKHNKLLNDKNAELVQQREEIAAQNEEISQKNIQITASISYASLIQQAALPSAEVMDSMFSDYFLIFRPLAIVAGDFYWVFKSGDTRVFVCADCTGHGVPGAFVSMLGISLLNEIVPNQIVNNGNAASTLNELKQKLMRSLGQSRELYEQDLPVNKDGMDLSIIIINQESQQLQYAGANRPLWMWHNGELLQTKPDKMPIGLHLGEERSFTNHILDITAGDIIYLFSDGITDQFGYLDSAHKTYKRYSTKRLFNLISEIAVLPLSEQKTRIEQSVDQWKNGHPQCDDNILIGIRI